MRDLEAIIDGYLEKFLHMLPAEDCETIFGNITDIHKLHADLLPKV